MKKALAVLLLILLTPDLLGLIAIAQTPSPSPGGNFITTLQLSLPLLLILLAILANRYDERYALALFAAALVTALFLTQAKYSGGFFAPGSETFIQFNITGPTNVYTGQSYTWNIQSGGYTPSWRIINMSTSTIVASGKGTSIQWTSPAPGRYVILATYTSIGNNSVYGYGVLVVNVQNPPSILGWIESAVVNAIKSVIQALVQGFGQGWIPALDFVVPLNELVYAPLPDSFATTLFYEIQQLSYGIAALMLAASVAYNALRGYYYDIVDLGSDVIYKLGVYALFSGAGLTIYEYAAGWINFIIEQTISTQLNAASSELFTALMTYITSWVATNVVPLGFGRALANLDTDILMFYFLFIALAVIRYSILMAAVSLIPLASAMWLFEWTRKIANIVIDLIVGLIMSGVIAGFAIAFLEELGFGIILFIAGPVIAGVDLAVTLFLTFTSLRPHEHLANAYRKIVS
ncbi:Ig-like domain repeat protein [Sulfolobus tengchongensis]|uniref:Ig-like domain repeat protein n=1 Tax=Sulfolobus tengchongensis TaxID=207809 RepID=A0AAX4L070_9CREN